MKTSCQSHDSCELPQAIFIARQPIFDRSQAPWGFELLYRSSKDALTAEVSDDSSATQSVIADGVTLALEGLPESQRRVLINFPEALLLEGTAYALPSESCVVEILETATPSPEVLAELKKLREAGYTIAMDDYLGEEHLEPFLEHADIIKVDILGLENDLDRIKEVVSKIKPYNSLLLAEKVENQQVFTMLHRLGFDLFQGFFFSRPEVIPGRKLASNELTKLQLLKELGKSDFEPREIARILKSDPSLSYRLFRYINSVGFGLSAKVESLDRAVALLGQRAIGQWLRTALFSDLNPTPKAGELVLLSVHRAKFLELLAGRLGLDKTVQMDSFFVVGLFSLLDAMLGMQMTDILDVLPLDRKISCALDGTCREYGLIELAHSYERGYWADINRRLKEMNLDQKTADALYVEARVWAQRALAV